jgi:hypothetical protein
MMTLPRRLLLLLVAALMVLTMAVVTAGPAVANCGDGDCSVGAAGTGGDKSEGKAQGFRSEGPGPVEGVSVTNSGNSDAGQFKVTGTRNGSLTGTFRDGTARGHGTGVFGDWAGQCELADFPDAC